MRNYTAFQKRVLDHVRNPIFDKPIPIRDFEKQGDVKLITKIKNNG